MIGQYLITFREVLEAALITAIILAYLMRTKRRHLSRYVWYGISIAVVACLVLGASMWLLYGRLSGASKALFEGVAALVAVFVLTSMLIWMATKGKEIKKEVERRMEVVVTRGMVFGLLSFSFIVVFREGLETVLFLTPFLVEDVASTLVGATLGIIASLILSYFIFVVGLRINIRRFFYFTSILLVLLAAGLVGYAVHELAEYAGQVGVDLGWWGEYAYALDIPREHVLHHKGAIGSVFAVMFGYTVKAEWARVIAHMSYMVIFLPPILWVYQKEVIQSAVHRFTSYFRRLLRVVRPHRDSQR